MTIAFSTPAAFCMFHQGSNTPLAGSESECTYCLELAWLFSRLNEWQDHEIPDSLELSTSSLTDFDCQTMPDELVSNSSEADTLMAEFLTEDAQLAEHQNQKRAVNAGSVAQLEPISVDSTDNHIAHWNGDDKSPRHYGASAGFSRSQKSFAHHAKVTKRPVPTWKVANKLRGRENILTSGKKYLVQHEDSCYSTKEDLSSLRILSSLESPFSQWLRECYQILKVTYERCKELEKLWNEKDVSLLFSNLLIARGAIYRSKNELYQTKDRESLSLPFFEDKTLQSALSRSTRLIDEPYADHPKLLISIHQSLEITVSELVVLATVLIVDLSRKDEAPRV